MLASFLRMVFLRKEWKHNMKKRESGHRLFILYPINAFRYLCDIFLVHDLSCFFFLVSLGGVRLGPLGTSATNWPIVGALDDR
jgi:hypothetical protein